MYGVRLKLRAIYFLSLIFFYNSFPSYLQAQNVEFVASIRYSDQFGTKFFKPKEGEFFQSFVIDTSNIFIQGSNFNYHSDLVIWNFNNPTSRTNPFAIKNFEALGIKKSKDFLVNKRTLELLNIKSGQRINPTKQDKSPWFSGGELMIALEDSILLYSYRHFYSYNTPKQGYLCKFDIFNNTLDSLILPIEIFRTGNASFIFNDIMIRGPIVTFLFDDTKVLPVPSYRKRTLGDQYTMNKICQWNMTNDVGLDTLTISKHYTTPWPEYIIGTDIWDNIYLLENISDRDGQGFLWVFSPGLKLISKIDILKIISNNPSMKENDFVEGRTLFEPFLLASFNENFELFFLSNTLKGLILFRFNYLELLKEYYLSQSNYELQLAINTIYARQGRKFKSKNLIKYFSSKYWYKPNTFYKDSMLSQFYLKCIQFLVELKNEKLYDN